MTVRAILNGRTAAVHTASADETVAAVVRRLTDQRIGAVPVIDGAAVVGIFSERDVIHAINAHGPAALDQRVGAVMTSPAVTIAPDTLVLAALSTMTRRRFRHLPVIEDGALIGLVSIGDLVKYRIEAIEAEAAAMRDYITGS